MKVGIRVSTTQLVSSIALNGALVRAKNKVVSTQPFFVLRDSIIDARGTRVEFNTLLNKHPDVDWEIIYLP
jgi:hypothetical protein